MTLQQLHYAIVISETGSLSRAAEVLYVAQPSLTSAIKELEKEVGITIFNRTGRGVTITNDGAEFLLYAKQVYSQYETLEEKYGRAGNLKKKFCVSAQHYSFAVKAFIETVKQFDTLQYEFAIRETKTKDVIDDVATLRSEIGILYLSNFNRAAIGKLLRASNLVFHKLIDIRAYIYVCKDHPLAGLESVHFSDLADYPCLSFEQGGNSSFYFAEEMLSTYDYPRIIKACDRATICNLMVGLQGYTICSGIIVEELNGDDYVAVPFAEDDPCAGDLMEIGYIVRKSDTLSQLGQLYIEEIRKYLNQVKPDI